MAVSAAAMISCNAAATRAACSWFWGGSHGGAFAAVRLVWKLFACGKLVLWDYTGEVRMLDPAAVILWSQWLLLLHFGERALLAGSCLVEVMTRKCGGTGV